MPRSTVKILALLLFGLAPALAAHEIPHDVTVQILALPEGARLHLVVRVPLGAMRDISFPQQAGGFLDLEGTAPLLSGAAKQWVSDFIEVYEQGNRLGSPEQVATRLSLLSDRSLDSPEQALGQFKKPPLPQSKRLVWDQLFLDALFDYPIGSPSSRFSIHPGLARLGVRVVIAVRFQPAGRSVRVFEFIGDPGLVDLDPSWHQAGWRFVKLGFLHILSGTDHLLFLVCLVIPFRKLSRLVPVVTAFTVAHSVTLIASAYDLAPGFLWFPPLVESLIAVSILYMALENILTQGSPARRWKIAFGFGLVHGFGFSFALREATQLAGSHLLASLLAFNLGVELGQLLVLLLLAPVVGMLLALGARQRTAQIVLSAIVAHTGWHWMLNRFSILGQYRFTWPALDLALLAELFELLLAAALLGGLFWLLGRSFEKLSNWLEQVSWKRLSSRPGIEAGLKAGGS